MSARLGVPALIATAALVVSFGLQATARAGTTRLARSDASCSGSGIPGAGSGASVFRTFCRETNESIRFGATFDWTAATHGGSGSRSGVDGEPLDGRSVYLSTRCRSDGLSSYDYAPGSAHTAAAEALQPAIWRLLGQIRPSGPDPAHRKSSQAQPRVSEAADAVGDESWKTVGSDRVLGVSADGSDPQRLMVLVPLPPAVLVGLALMTGIGAVCAVRRMRRSTSA